MIVLSLVALATAGVAAIWGHSLVEVTRGVLGEDGQVEVPAPPPPTTNKDLL